MMNNNEHSGQRSATSERDDADFRANLVELIPFLRAFARTLCGRREEADDLAQEALAKAWQSRASFEPGSNLKAWLFMILRNQFYSERRRSWRQTPWDQELADRTLVLEGAQQSSINLADLTRAMKQLPDEQREALILVGAGGFAYEEVARICGVAVGTIKSRVARARRALDKVLNGDQALAGAPRPSHAEAADDVMGQLDDLVSGKKVPAGATSEEESEG